jgi:exosome complex component RRP42
MLTKPYKIDKKRIVEYLEAGKRLDGRGNFDLRDIEIKTNISKNAEGSVSVKIGETEVACGIKMDVGTPYTDHEKEGTMITSMELLPLSSPDFEYGPPRIQSIEPARIIDRGIRESGFIDFEKLCIEEGEKVWNIFIDLATINDDGNLIDAGALAAVIALKIARLPVYDKETERVKYGEFTDEGLPLTDKMPITTTFYKAGDHLLVDPTRAEEKTTDGRLTVEISDATGEQMVTAMQKGGESTLSIGDVEKIISEAGKIFKNIKNLVEEEVKKASKEKR